MLDFNKIKLHNKPDSEQDMSFTQGIFINREMTVKRSQLTLYLIVKINFLKKKKETIEGFLFGPDMLINHTQQIFPS